MKMKINKTTVKIIYDIEEIIGSNCYNSQARRYWNDTPGNYIRYPATIWGDKEQTEIYSTKYSCLKNKNIPVKNITTLEYQFGVNWLRIGKGIIETLEMLEERYGLDFYELEKSYKKTQK